MPLRLTVCLGLVCALIDLSFGQPVLKTTDRLNEYSSYCENCGEIEPELVRFKQQAIQSFAVHTGLLADPGTDLLSSRYLETSLGSGIPLGSFENIIGVKPRFRIDWIDAEASLEIPEELYQFEVQLFYRRPIHDRLSIMTIFSPSIRSDLSTSDDAFRVFALALLNWECVPDQLTLSAGAVYLGRADLPVLPALGLSWTPSRTARLDLRFPSSRLAYRLSKHGTHSETWAYLDVGIGGNTWAVTRDNSDTDELSLRDIRLTLGVEKIVDGGGGWFIDGGVALNRRLEYERAGTEFALGDGILLNGGWRY